MNPRETIFEEFIDEFEIEQAIPLEFVGYVPGEDLLDTTVSNYFKDPSCLYNKFKMRSTVGTEHLAKISRLPTNAELAYCFQNVPDVYFRTDFFAKHTDIVHAIVALDDCEDTISLGREAISSDSSPDTASVEDVDLRDIEYEDEQVSSSASWTNTGPYGPSSSRSGRASAPGGAVIADTGGRSGVTTAAKATATLPSGGTLVVPGTSPAGRLSEARLTNYLDLVEVALLRQIMSKSTAFFRALDDIHNLQSMVSRAATRIIHLRRELRGFDNEIVAGPVRIPRYVTDGVVGLNCKGGLMVVLT